jgi:hypothetical protein
VKTQKHEVEERGIRVHLRFEPACSSYYRTTPASVNVSNVHQRQRQAARGNEHQSALPVQHLVESKQDELIPITIEFNIPDGRNRVEHAKAIQLQAQECWSSCQRSSALEKHAREPHTLTDDPACGHSAKAARHWSAFRLQSHVLA